MKASRSQPSGVAATPLTTGLNAEPSAALDPRYWEVEVRICGERVLTIGHSHLSGLSDIDQYADVIRGCADHLRAFIGSGEPVPCFGCGGSGQERWMGANGEEVGPCSVCSDGAALGDCEAIGPSQRTEDGLTPGMTNKEEPQK